MLEIRLFGAGQARYFEQPLAGFSLKRAWTVTGSSWGSNWATDLIRPKSLDSGARQHHSGILSTTFTITLGQLY